ncbi:unnamed protein product [Clonostachys chloroleuca]|uniref:Uncharacterized protein n=1 Tax=Clonostachys chloroleuca TaxID=1926264 RepID=A0AA35M5M7_9HYPO|nr:unnamed protein product [Clonostachys chloroleuca]
MTRFEADEYRLLGSESHETASPWKEASNRMQEVHDWEAQMNCRDSDDTASEWSESQENEDCWENSADEDFFGIEKENAQECQRLARELLREAQEKLQMIAEELRIHNKGTRYLTAALCRFETQTLPHGTYGIVDIGIQGQNSG